MGVWSDYCLICGGPYTNEDLDDIIYDDCEWLLYSYTISKREELFETELVDCGVSSCNDNKFIVCPFLSGDFEDHEEAIACHRNCYQLLKDELNYSLKFSDVHNLLDESICVLKNHKLYGKMEEYSFGQEFEAYCFIENKWLLENPLVNDDNKKR